MNLTAKDVEKYADVVAGVLADISRAVDWNSLKTANIIVAAVRASIGILAETVHGSISETDALARLKELRAEIEAIDAAADRALADKFDASSD